jgi:hypothetical protein
MIYSPKVDSNLYPIPSQLNITNSSIIFTTKVQIDQVVVSTSSIVGGAEKEKDHQ